MHGKQTPRARFLTGVLILIVAAPACSLKRPKPAVPLSFPRQEVIAEIKDFQETLGFQDAKNFLRYSATTRAFYRCYFTGKLELPVSYEALQLTQGNEAGCALDEQKYDVFFYPIEAVASGTNPVTPALTESALERFLVLVPHEDFHNQEETEESSPEIGEAAATLIGFLTARQFAKQKYGLTSQTFQNLNGEAQLFLQKAATVNAYYDKVSDLYSSFRSGKISREDTLARKEELFAQMQQECSGITPDPVSFNKCPASMNNAGLAFDRTYVRYYPLLFDLYVLQGQDTRTTIVALKRLLATEPQSETELINALGAILSMGIQ